MMIRKSSLKIISKSWSTLNKTTLKKSYDFFFNHYHLIIFLLQIMKYTFEKQKNIYKFIVFA